MLSIHGNVAVMTLWTHRAATADWDVRVANERAIIAAWLDARWAGISNTQCRADNIKTWRMDTAFPEKWPDYVHTITGTSAGAGATIMPAQLALVVALRTEPVGASVRGINGRIYHSGMTATMFAAGTGHASSLHVSNVLSAYNELRTNLKEGVGGTAQGTWCIVSYRAGGTRTVPVYRPVPLVKYVDHLLVETRVDIQRRRAARQQSYALGS